MIPMSSEMLSELVETLDAAGVGLDKMDWDEEPVRAKEYQHLASFCFRMLAVIPKNQPGLAELLQTRASLQEIWSVLQTGHDLTRGAPWTAAAQDVLAQARHPEQLQNVDDAKRTLRLLQKRLKRS